LKTKAIRTPYWEPGCDYIAIIIKAIRNQLRDGDIVVISEKAVSTAKGQLVDEAEVTPNLLAKIIARLWMPFVWGYVLGPICRFRTLTIRRLRSYPSREGATHKQVALSYAGLLHALKYGSEGGIDLSNLPFSYAALPLRDGSSEAKRIWSNIEKATGRKVVVMISDTDSTFSMRNIHFTSLPNPINGIHYFPGPLLFVLGRALGLKQRATPIAIVGSNLDVAEALEVAEKAHHARGYGAGRTVWDMVENAGIGVSGVTWEMLGNSKHYPIVLVRLMKIS
jgi:F420-0:gamma-glutamyl ligase-like protein